MESPENHHRAGTNLRGPLKNASVLIENFNGLPRGSVPEMMADLVPQGPEASQRGRLIGAVALKWAQGCEDSPAFDRRTAMDLTGCINGDKGILSFDLPEGKWRIFFLYQTRRGGRKYYMNLLDRESVRVQIDAVLKPHYEMLKEELGITWEGFFYDEPEVGNTPDYDFNCLPGWRPGKTPISLPWCDQMPELLRERLGDGTMFYTAPKEGLIDPNHSVQIGISFLIVTRMTIIH